MTIHIRSVRAVEASLLLFEALLLGMDTFVLRKTAIMLTVSGKLLVVASLIEDPLAMALMRLRSTVTVVRLLGLTATDLLLDRCSDF